MTCTLKLGVDIDNVCANYTEGFKSIVATELSVDPETLPEITQWGYAQWGLSDEKYLQLHKKAVEEYRMFKHLEPLKNCAETLWRLSDAGIWIRLITHRLYTNWTHQTAVSDTVFWLDKHEIPYRDLCFLGAKPEVEADLYIDDAPHNIRQLRNASNTVIVFGQPYNQELLDPRVNNWEEAEKAILTLAAEQRGVQGQLPGLEAEPKRIQKRKNK